MADVGGPKGRVRATVIVGLVVGALTSACSSYVDAQPPSPAQIRADWPGCVKAGAFADRSGDGAPTGRGAIPFGFQPRVVVLCTRGDRPDRTGQPVQVDLERTSTQVGLLVEYLARPSRRFRGGRSGPCPAVAWSPPWLFLIDGDDRWIAPQIPTDPCGLPLDDLEDGGPAYERLAYRDLAIPILDRE